MLHPHPRTKLTKTSSTEHIQAHLDKISHVLKSDKLNKNHKADKKTQLTETNTTHLLFLFPFFIFFIFFQKYTTHLD
jgi:hypothetical protein